MAVGKEKILLISPYFPPDYAGTGFVMEELAEDLARSGKEVTVLAGHTQSGSAYRAYQSIVRVRRIRHCYQSKDWKFGRILNYITFPLAILCHPFLLKQADTVIIVSTVPTTIGLSVILKKIFKQRILYIWQDIYPDLAVHLGALTSHSLLARGMRWINESGLSHTDHIVVLGSSMEQYLATHYPRHKHKVHTINNWEDPKEIFPLSKDNPWSRTSNYYGKFVVLYSGNIGLFQNFDPIIGAAELLRQDPTIIFLFVGGGGSKERLQKIVREKNLSNVDFMDYVDNRDYPYLLASADCHIVSLKSGMEQFGFPGKLYSSLAAGRPVLVIGDRDGELAQTVLKYSMGLVATNAQELTENIQRLKKDPALADMLGNNGRQSFVKQWDRHIATQQYLHLLNRKDATTADVL